MLERSPAGVIGKGAQVTLDASASSDPEEQPLRFAWRQLSGEEVALSSSDEAIVTFEAPLTPGELVFSLVVSDGRNESSPVYARMSIDFNTPPSVALSDNVSVPAGESVLLAGRASDSDGDGIASWSWRVEASPELESYTLAGATTPNPVFTPHKKGYYTLTVSVEDSRGAVSGAQSVVVRALNVAPSTSAPAIVAGANLSEIAVTAAAQDFDGDTLSYQWLLEGAPAAAALPILAGTDTPTLSVTPKGKGLYTFAFSASDGDAQSVLRRVVVAAQNNLPTVTVDATQAAANLAPYTLTATTQDIDGDPVTLLWEMDDPFGHAYTLTTIAETTVFTPLEKGPFRLRVTPFDGEHQGATQLIDFNATNLSPVAMPVAEVNAIAAGEDVMLTAAASYDPDGPTTLTYKWSVSQGSATIIGPDDQETVVVRAGSIKEQLEIELIVRDEETQASFAQTATIEVNNTAPIAVAGVDSYADVGSVVQLDGSQSYDLETSATSLIYHWTSPSHPNLQFQPSHQVREPIFTAPLDLVDVVLSLTVSDGQVTSEPDTMVIKTVPGNALYVFVQAGSGCSSNCGTRAAPYPDIPQAVAAVAGMNPKKGIVVAVGDYDGPVTVPGGVTLIGGCDPTTWYCPTDGSAGQTILWGGPTDLTTLTINAPALAKTVIRNLTVFGSDGSGMSPSPPSHSTVALYCDGCKAEISDVHAEADGVDTDVEYAFGIITSGSQPVTYTRVTAVGGHARFNYGMQLYNASNVTVEDSTITTQTVGRMASPGKETLNEALYVGGSGTDNVFRRNKIILQGSPGMTFCYAIEFPPGNTHAKFYSNFIWHKGACNRAHDCCSQTSRANVAVLHWSDSDVDFINNTFLGNDGAFNQDGGMGNPAIHAWRNPWSFEQTAPLSTFKNNYFQRFKTMVLTTAPGEVFRFSNNTFHSYNELSCHPGGCSWTPGDLDTGHGAAAPGGTGNTVGDCLLTANDYHLNSGSPCIGSGVADAGTPPYDLDGEERATTGAIERGADEVTP